MIEITPVGAQIAVEDWQTPKGEPGKCLVVSDEAVKIRMPLDAVNARAVATSLRRGLTSSVAPFKARKKA